MWISVTLIENFEKVMGTIEEGWSNESSFNSVQVVRTKHLYSNAVVYSTLGLSRHKLGHPPSDIIYSLELSICLDAQSEGRWVPAILGEVAEKIAASHIAPVRGDVIDLGLNFVPAKTFSAFYVTAPLFLDDDHRTIKGENGGEIAIAWLMPISVKESTFITKAGWRAFEDLIDDKLDRTIDMSRHQFV